MGAEWSLIASRLRRAYPRYDRVRLQRDNAPPEQAGQGVGGIILGRDADVLTMRRFDLSAQVIKKRPARQQRQNEQKKTVAQSIASTWLQGSIDSTRLWQSPIQAPLKHALPLFQQSYKRRPIRVSFNQLVDYLNRAQTIIRDNPIATERIHQHG